MADILELEIATPERLLVKESVSDVQAPARDGYMGILPGHAALLAEMGTGILSYQVGPRRWYLTVHGGFLEVVDNHVRILANVSERAEDIDVERAKRALQRAQDQLVNPALGVDPAVALEAVARAQARLEAGVQK